MVQRQEKYWSQYASTYDEDVEYVVGKTLRQAIVKRLLGECGLGEVIEFGCGAGYFTKAIAENAKHIIATDLSDQMLGLARSQLKDLRNVTVQKDDCERSCFPSGSFDTVFMANLIHTIERPDKALRESHRILRNRGLLLLTCYTDYGTNWFDKMELGLRYFLKFGIPPGYYRNYSPDGLGSLVENNGFEIEEIEVMGDKARALYLKGRRK
jgi:ubiquinone/menaquinone biosynthesis C-methylase UbiE